VSEQPEQRTDQCQRSVWFTPGRAQRGGVNHLGHWLSGYLDGELPPTTAGLVAEHLGFCPTCRAAAAEHSRVKVDLRDLGGPLPSAGLLDSLMQLPGSDGPARPPSFAGFATAPVGPTRRKRPAAVPLVVAGVAGVAALTMASAVFTGAAPQRVHHTARPPLTGGRVRSAPDVVNIAHSVPRTTPTPAAARPPEGPFPIGLPGAAAVELVRGPG
jgi:anti-sigma factor RsiW